MRKILRGAMRVHACKSEVINEQYCSYKVLSVHYDVRGHITCLISAFWLYVSHHVHSLVYPICNYFIV